MVVQTDCDGCRGTSGVNGCPVHSTFTQATAPLFRYPIAEGWVCPRCQLVDDPKGDS